VSAHDDSRFVTLVGPIGKPETINLPMVFLHAILENELDRFAIAARDATHTTWEVPGAGPVRLPSDFLNEIQEMLKFQSVVSWLDYFGSQGRSVAPLVAGNLLGLAFRDKSKSRPSSSEAMNTENLVRILSPIVRSTGRLICRCARRSDQSWGNKMPTNKRKKKATEYTLDCVCGEKAAMFELEKGYMTHCPNCGAVTFFDNPLLLERLRFGGSCRWLYR
jgi:hypothetical protein